ncbi:MAG: DUF1015 domain-containing protein [Desulfobacterales bacterium]|nr:DUF1015 domain-containing protein [Desulfobacterales bacterium]
MATIAPFKGLTYDFSLRQDFPALVAPPYDVISEKKQNELYGTHPKNVIRLILGKKKTGDSDLDNWYTRAADYFKRWESEETLTQSGQPCIYVTSLTYDPGNGDPLRTRWGIIALVRIEDQDSGVILPHEKTFSAHKDDRLELMRICSAQFSQIFGLYEDPENRISDDCIKTIDFPPQIALDLEDGTKHRLWALHSPPLFKKIADVMSKKSIFIADGHHRYESSRNFRNIMRARYVKKSTNRSYEYVMMYLSNMDNEGLTILPSHRLIKSVPGFRLDPFLEKLGTWFNISKAPFTDTDVSRKCASLKQKLEQEGRSNTAMAFYQHKAGSCYLLSLKPDKRDEIGEELDPSLKELDVIVLSKLILQRGLGFNKKNDLDNEKIFHYHSSMETAVSQVESGIYQMAFLLNPTRIDQVKEIARKSLIMPRKSTYFYPKVLTGLVFNKIDPYETIRTP